MNSGGTTFSRPSTTATRSVKGLRCSSSPLGSGLAFWKRLKASRTSSGVQGLGDLGLGDLRFGVLGFRALAFDLGFGAFGAFFNARAELDLASLVFLALALFADFFGTDRTPALLAR